MSPVLEKLSPKSDAPTQAELTQQVETLRADLATLTNSIADLVKAKGDDAAETAKAKAADLGNKAQDAAETARLQAMELQDHANDFITKQPGTALGLAAGFGFLVGFLGSRK